MKDRFISFVFSLQLQHLSRCPLPAAAQAQDLAEDCLAIADSQLANDAAEAHEWRELAELLCKESTDGLLCTHDRIVATRMSAAAQGAAANAPVTVGGEKVNDYSK